MGKGIALFVFLLLSSTLGFASGDPLLYQPEFKCPRTHSIVQRLLIDVKKLQKEFKEKLPCSEVKPDFKRLVGLLGKRKEVLGIFKREKGTKLTPEDADKIQNYTATVTEEAGVLISSILSMSSTDSGFGSLFTGGKKCQLDEEDELKAMATLTSAVYEATSVLSKVAGPYGVPLQVGVGTMSGVINGFQAFMRRKKNIDFTSSYDGVNDQGLSKRQYYETAICTMVDFDFRVNRIANPSKHLGKLKYVREKAKATEEVYLEKCEECKPIIEAKTGKDAKFRFDNLVKKKKKVSPVVMKVVRKAYNGRLDLDWLDKEIETFQDIVDSSQGIGIFEVSRLKRILNHFLYKTATKDFLKYYITEVRKQNKLFVKQIQKVSKALKIDLKENAEVINYVEHQKGLKETAGQLYKKLEKEYYTANHPPLFQPINSYLAYFGEFFALSQIKQSSNALINHSELLSTQIADVIDQWRVSSSALGIVSEYCEFFKKIKQYRFEVKDVCESFSFQWHNLKSAYGAFYLQDLIRGQEEALKFRGPYDFKLEAKLSSIEIISNQGGLFASFPDLGLNFQDLITYEKKVIAEDPFAKFSTDQDKRGNKPFDKWWEGAMEVDIDEAFLDLVKADI